MTAGLNMRMRVWHMHNLADDSAGGAVLTGTMVADNVAANIAESSQAMLMKEQGLEMPSTYTVLLKLPHVEIRERDELEVRFPPLHYLYGKRLRVVSVALMPYGPHDRRGYVKLTVSRAEYSHSVA